MSETFKGSLDAFEGTLEAIRRNFRGYYERYLEGNLQAMYGSFEGPYAFLCAPSRANYSSQYMLFKCHLREFLPPMYEGISAPMYEGIACPQTKSVLSARAPDVWTVSARAPAIWIGRRERQKYV